MLKSFENIEVDLNESLEKIAPDVLKFIEHFDCNHPIKSLYLENNFNLTGPEIRAIIRYLRRMGYPIGSSSRGYYLIRTEEEKLLTIEHLKNRRDSISRTIEEMEKIQINKSILQLNLKQ